MLTEIVSAYEQEIKFIIGFAGSGKSTRLADMSDDETLVLTPTHKAARVLSAKGVHNVGTIHAALKLVPTIDQDFRRGQKLQKLKRLGGVDMADITRVFIDEFSMINTKILDMLLGILPDKAEVTIFGDPYQLPPVEGDIVYPEDYTTDVELLTTQYRAEAPEVIETFMRFMEYLRDGKGSDLRMNKNIVHGSLSTFNPETDRALAYTNQRALEINNEIAKLVGLADEYEFGESLTANGMDCVYSEETFEDYDTLTIYPKCMSKGKLKEPMELELCSDATEADILKYGTEIDYPVAYIDIDDKIYHLYYDVDHYANNKKLKAEVEAAQFRVIDDNRLGDDVKLPQWCKDNRSASGVKERGWAWSAYLAHSNLVFSLQRPFATTVHKAQGSSYRLVFIAQDDIKKAIRGNNYKQYARLMYVALSRAEKGVIIV